MGIVAVGIGIEFESPRSIEKSYEQVFRDGLRDKMGK